MECHFPSSETWREELRIPNCIPLYNGYDEEAMLLYHDDAKMAVQGTLHVLLFSASLQEMGDHWFQCIIRHTYLGKFLFKCFHDEVRRCTGVDHE